MALDYDDLYKESMALDYDDLYKESKKDGIPPDIFTVYNLYPYIYHCIDSILDIKNFKLNKELCCLITRDNKDIEDIARSTLIDNRFSRYAASHLTHPFHWFAIENNLIGFINEDYILVPYNFYQREILISQMTSKFIRKYGNLVLARIEKIREHKTHRPY